MKPDFFYDVAHNKNGVGILVKDLKKIYNEKPIGVLVLKKDKINPELIDMVSKAFDRLIISTVPSKDILNKEEITNNSLLQKFEFIDNLHEAMTIIDKAEHSGGKVIFGSHYIAKDVYNFFDFSFDNGII
jgi:dihydrofolate synthase/folylpolyglutamate synthase